MGAVSDITVAALTAISDVAGIKLQWSYSDPRSGALPNIALDANEVWAATVNNRADGSFAKVGEGITDFLHAGLSRGATRYYWVRARDKIGGLGAFYPSGATSGVSGTEASGDVLIATNGYWKHPSGLIIQWGYDADSGSGDTTVTYPTPFPNSVFSVVCTHQWGSNTTFYGVNVSSVGNSSFAASYFQITAGGLVHGGGFMRWIATGY
jgi:hypothetical protein